MDWYNKIFKKPWPYWVGGSTLALLNILLLISTGTVWKVTSGFLYWGIGILQKMGVDATNWYYFSVYNNGVKEGEDLFRNSLTVLNIAVITGALIAILMSSEFKIKKIKNFKQFLCAIGGGFIMGYGTRLSFGCNIGAFFSAIPSLSLHGWLFAASLFFGAWIGCRILFKYII